MAVVFRQWVDAFDAETEETGCSLTIANPQTQASEITSTIASASDTGDRATADITSGAKLPAGSEARTRFKFRTPVGFDLLANSVFLHVRNSGGEAICELFATDAQLIKIYTAPTILTSGGGVFDASPPTTLAADTEYTIEFAWSKNGVLKLWVNESQVANYTMSGATGDAVPAAVRVGIDHYDGADTNGWTAKYRLFQLADDAAVALSDPLPPGRIYKRFTGPAYLTGSVSTLYTVPTGMRARILSTNLTNGTAFATAAFISIGVMGGDTSKQIYNDLVRQEDHITDFTPYDPAAGEIIQAFANDVDTVNLTISGWEQPE